MHDYAWRTEAGFDHHHFLYAWLLPHTAEDSGRIPHAHQTLDHIDPYCLAAIQLAFIYIASLTLATCSAAEMANYGGIDQNHFSFTLDANAGSLLFNSTKGQERIVHRHGFRILHLGGDGNRMLHVFTNERHRELARLIIVFPTSPRLVVGARVDW